MAELQVVAWATHHDEPMLFPTRAEAAEYCDDGEEPQALVRISEATARIAEIEADRDRTERNRDMWKGQCERQALTLEALRIAIKEHNDGCNSACNARRAAGKTSCPMLGYDRDCGDCPRDWLIESMNIHPLPKEVEA